MERGMATCRMQWRHGSESCSHFSKQCQQRGGACDRRAAHHGECTSECASGECSIQVTSLSSHLALE
eukprot:6492157-Amphidinium_carterae.4